ncbi:MULTISPECIES: IS3 family transposase [Oscillospiraceae]|uniref:IS3 family transposase n=2 Tax=Eubacteriales TaxID=186802 RepID=A0AAE3JAW2_9FIRM|nr:MULTISPECIES: IS3 family transposase [Oscillospiraceae]MCC2211897.1 IS3 family transposase [Hominilimicola fabiformis]MDR3921963.1 IS3 family transposase [Clostridia bacterium]MDR4080387.1 IS3 family transposase [Clostridia bacterium]
MAKYSFEFKMEVVQAYLNAEGGYRYLASKYNIPAKRRIEEWVHAYREFGEEGLMRSRQNKKYTFQFKLSMVELYLSSEVSYQELALSQGISNPSLIVKWVNDFRIAGPDALRPKKKGRKKTLDIRECKKPSKYDGEKPVDTSAEHVKELEDELLKLRIENAYLKELRRLRLEEENSSEKTARIVHSLRGQFKLKDILAVVGFPKATYMYWQKRFDRENPDKQLEDEITKIHIENKDYGYRRVYRELRNRKIFVNKKKVQRIMQKLCFQVTSFTRKSRRYNSYKGNVGKIAPNRINRRFNTSVPHQKITTDTTEFKYYEIDNKGRMVIKKLYLDPFLDMFNGEVLSYGISKTPSAASVLSAQKQAIEITSDCPYRRTFHSDRGWAYQMGAYSSVLKENKIFQSMSRKGNCYDNSVMENFFGILKQEMYYGTTYYSFEELKDAIERYIKYYNEKRIKEKLGWMSPVEYRLNTLAA